MLINFSWISKIKPPWSTLNSLKNGTTFFKNGGQYFVFFLHLNLVFCALCKTKIKKIYIANNPNLPKPPSKLEQGGRRLPKLYFWNTSKQRNTFEEEPQEHSPEVAWKKIRIFCQFVCYILPTPLAGAWVNRWTFSPPLSSDFQLFVSVRYRKRCGGVGPWQCMPYCFPYTCKKNFYYPWVHEGL